MGAVTHPLIQTGLAAVVLRRAALAAAAARATAASAAAAVAAISTDAEADAHAPAAINASAEFSAAANIKPAQETPNSGRSRSVVKKRLTSGDYQHLPYQNSLSLSQSNSQSHAPDPERADISGTNREQRATLGPPPPVPPRPTSRPRPSKSGSASKGSAVGSKGVTVSKGGYSPLSDTAPSDSDDENLYSDVEDQSKSSKDIVRGGMSAKSKAVHVDSVDSSRTLFSPVAGATQPSTANSAAIAIAPAAVSASAHAAAAAAAAAAAEAAAADAFALRAAGRAMLIEGLAWAADEFMPITAANGHFAAHSDYSAFNHAGVGSVAPGYESALGQDTAAHGQLSEHWDAGIAPYPTSNTPHSANAKSSASASSHSDDDEDDDAPLDAPESVLGKYMGARSGDLTLAADADANLSAAASCAEKPSVARASTTSSNAVSPDAELEIATNAALSNHINTRNNIEIDAKQTTADSASTAMSQRSVASILRSNSLACAAGLPTYTGPLSVPTALALYDRLSALYVATFAETMQFFTQTELSPVMPAPTVSATAAAVTAPTPIAEALFERTHFDKAKLSSSSRILSAKASSAGADSIAASATGHASVPVSGLAASVSGGAGALAISADCRLARLRRRAAAAPYNQHPSRMLGQLHALREDEETGRHLRWVADRCVSAAVAAARAAAGDAGVRGEGRTENSRSHKAADADGSSSASDVGASANTNGSS